MALQPPAVSNVALLDSLTTMELSFPVEDSVARTRQARVLDNVHYVEGTFRTVPSALQAEILSHFAAGGIDDFSMQAWQPKKNSIDTCDDRRSMFLYLSTAETVCEMKVSRFTYKSARNHKNEQIIVAELPGPPNSSCVRHCIILPPPPSRNGCGPKKFMGSAIVRGIEWRTQIWKMWTPQHQRPQSSSQLPILRAIASEPNTLNQAAMVNDCNTATEPGNQPRDRIWDIEETDDESEHEKESETTVTVSTRDEVTLDSSLGASKRPMSSRGADVNDTETVRIAKRPRGRLASSDSYVPSQSTSPAPVVNASCSGIQLVSPDEGPRSDTGKQHHAGEGPTAAEHDQPVSRSTSHINTRMPKNIEGQYLNASKQPSPNDQRKPAVNEKRPEAGAGPTEEVGASQPNHVLTRELVSLEEVKIVFVDKQDYVLDNMPFRKCVSAAALFEYAFCSGMANYDTRVLEVQLGKRVPEFVRGDDEDHFEDKVLVPLKNLLRTGSWKEDERVVVRKSLSGYGCRRM